MIKKAYVPLMFMVLSGCTATTYVTYKDTIEESKVAVLDCNQGIQVISVDGDKTVNPYSRGGIWYTGCDIRVAPGAHVVTFKYDMSFDVAAGGGTMTSNTSTGNTTLKFDAKPGRKYKINYTAQKASLFSMPTYHFTIDDIGVRKL